MSACPLAVPVRVGGTVRSLVLRCRAQVPALEVELYDGSDSLTVVFLGRRGIRGITPGRELIVTGRVTKRGAGVHHVQPHLRTAPGSRVTSEKSGEQSEAETPAQVGDIAGVDLQSALGGKLGMTESGLPSLVFIVIYTVNGQVLPPALWGALGTAAVLSVLRIVRRSSIQYALAGTFGVALSAFIASRTGNAANFYLPGLLLQAGYAVAYLGSIVVGWPLIGVVLGPLLGEGLTWRDDPDRKRAYTQVSWIWFGMFAVRLAAQLPLYLLSMTVALGWVKLAMGWPLFALVLWVSYLILRKAPPPRPRPHPDPDPASDAAHDPDRPEPRRECGLKVCCTSASESSEVTKSSSSPASSESSALGVSTRRSRTIDTSAVSCGSDTEPTGDPTTGEVAGSVISTRLASPCSNSMSRTTSPTLTASSTRADISRGVDTATSTPQPSVNSHSFFGWFTRATTRGTPYSVFESNEMTRFTLSSPVAAITTW